MALVKYNRASIMGMAHAEPLPKDAKPGAQPNPMHEHTLMPGINDIPDDKWDVIQKHPTVAALLEDGTIEEVGGLDGAKFFKAPLAKVKKAISETIDHGLLATWKKGEKRADVQKALDARIMELQVNPAVDPAETEKVNHPKDNSERVQNMGANLNP